MLASTMTVCVSVSVSLTVCKLLFSFTVFFLFHLKNNSFISLRPAGSVVWLDERPTLSAWVCPLKILLLLKRTFVAGLKLFPMIS